MKTTTTRRWWFLLSVWCSSSSSSSSSSSCCFCRAERDGKGITTWHEIRPRLTQNELDPDLQSTSLSTSTPRQKQKQNRKRRQRQRKLFWDGRYDEEGTWKPDYHKQQSTTTTITTHPLRTDLWNLNIRWKGKEEKRLLHNNWLADTLQVEFHTNGYCVTKHAHNQKAIGVGVWKIFPWGVRFTLQDFSNGDESGYEYTFTAGWHPNPFGKQPKMMQGSIVRSLQGAPGAGAFVNDSEQDEPFLKKPPRNWFRSVVGTFSGGGIGKDMADFSYKNRGVGLSQ